MKPVLRFYYREGCHLCEDMWQELEQQPDRRSIELVAVNVDSDQTLQQRYGQLIPVLEGDSGPICNYYLDLVALRNYLQQR